MERDILCGKHLCKQAIIEDSKFINVGMARVEFDDVDLSDARFHNVNMSRVTFNGIELDRATFKYVGLTNVSIEECVLDGMTINGIPVTDMIAAYEQASGNEKEVPS